MVFPGEHIGTSPPKPPAAAALIPAIRPPLPSVAALTTSDLNRSDTAFEILNAVCVAVVGCVGIQSEIRQRWTERDERVTMNGQGRRKKKERKIRPC